MDITPTRDIYNPVLKRREITFYVEHLTTATPKLYDLRKQVAVKYATDEALVFVRSVRTLAGTSKAIGDAEVYDSVEDVRVLIPEHIRVRNQSERHKAEEGSAAPKKKTKQKKG
jgi:ribosomal protein S24E